MFAVEEYPGAINYDISTNKIPREREKQGCLRVTQAVTQAQLFL